MKRILLTVTGAFALFSSPSFASGEQAQQDIECAAWASFTGSFAEDEESERMFSMAFSFFLGHYVALAGEDFSDPLNAALNAMDESRETYDRYSATCLPRMEAQSNRVIDWANDVTSQGDNET